MEGGLLVGLVEFEAGGEFVTGYGATGDEHGEVEEGGSCGEEGELAEGAAGEVVIPEVPWWGVLLLGGCW